MTVRQVNFDDLTRLRWPLDPAISADGDTVAYVVSGPDLESDKLAYELCIQDFDGGPVEKPDPGRRVRLPRWSANGALAYLVEVEDLWQLVLLGSDRVLTSGPYGVSDYDWNSEGTKLAVLLPEAGVVQVIDKASGDTESIALPAGVAVCVRWSPDSEKIAVAGSTEDIRKGVVWLLSASGEADQVHLWDGPIHAIAWSPEGSSIALSGRQQQAGWLNSELWVIGVTGGEPPRQLAPDLDRSIGQAVRGDDERGTDPAGLLWSPTGEKVTTIFSDGGRSVLATIGLDGSVEVLAEGNRAVLDFAATAGGRHVVFSWSDSNNPGELSTLNDGKELVLTSINESWLATKTLGDTTHFTTTDDGGNMTEAWLTRPPHADGPFPLVLQVHGGPHYSVGYRFSFDAQRWASLGMAVVRSNPRGSQGYGESVAKIQGCWGGPDFDDLMTVVDGVSDRFDTDSTLMAIVGESYGGFMVNWAIGHTNRFAAAVSENGISDLMEMGSGPGGPDFWYFELGGSPDEEPARYQERSPLSHMEAIETPLLMVHAEDDSNCPIRQSERLHEAMTSAGKDVALVRVPNEGHLLNLFGRPSSRVRRTRIIDAFLVRHLSEPRLTNPMSDFRNAEEASIED